MFLNFSLQVGKKFHRYVYDSKNVRLPQCIHPSVNIPLRTMRGPSWVQPMFLTYGSEDSLLVPGETTGDLESRRYRDSRWSDG